MGAPSMKFAGGMLFWCVLLAVFTAVSYFYLEDKVWSNLGAYVSKDGQKINYLDKSGLFWDMVLKTMAYFSVSTIILNIPNCVIDAERTTRRNAVGWQIPGQMKVWYSKMIRVDSDIMFPCLSGMLERQNGLSLEVLQKMFEGTQNLRVGKFGLICGKFIIVSFGLVANIWSLPDRDPLVPLNQAKHYVVYLENIVLVKFWMQICWGALQRNSEFVKGLKLASGWSAFSLLNALNLDLFMSALMERVDRSRTLFNPTYLCVIAVSMTTAFVGGRCCSNGGQVDTN